ncbi:hypothetical protein, partial [Acidiphilium sp.]|uniref:hypothetical protein n=1 Tax=Acidiphilium sp. TaxID=527 RepID=UPI002588254A
KGKKSGKGKRALLFCKKEAKNFWLFWVGLVGPGRMIGTAHSVRAYSGAACCRCAAEVITELATIKHRTGRHDHLAVIQRHPQKTTHPLGLTWADQFRAIHSLDIGDQNVLSCES